MRRIVEDALSGDHVDGQGEDSSAGGDKESGRMDRQPKGCTSVCSLYAVVAVVWRAVRCVIVAAAEL